MHLITLTLFIAFSVLQLAHAQSLNSTRVITADSKDIDTIGDLITEECLQEVSVFEVGILIFTAFSQFFPCWRHSLSPFLFRTTRPVLHLPSVAKQSVRNGTNFEHTTASIVGRFWAGTDGVFGFLITKTSTNSPHFSDTRSDHSFLIIAFIVGLTALICLISVGVCVYCLWHNSGIPAAYRVISKRIRSYKGRGSPKIVPVYGLPTVSKMGQENRMWESAGKKRNKEKG